MYIHFNILINYNELKKKNDYELLFWTSNENILHQETLFRLTFKKHLKNVFSTMYPPEKTYRHCLCLQASFLF